MMEDEMHVGNGTNSVSENEKNEGPDSVENFISSEGSDSENIALEDD